ncbi:MAG: hypothetical protein MSH66_00700 [Bacteroidales bacterium]|nr:hypothetical protein [Bacteroidales bacterium]
MEVLLVLLALCLIVHLISKIDLREESTPKQKKDDYHYRNVDDQLWEYNNKKQRKIDKEFNDDSSYVDGPFWVHNNKKRNKDY